MVRVVEQYIQDTTGKKVRIIFNDMFNVRRHTQMLAAAYSYVLQKQETNV